MSDRHTASAASAPREDRTATEPATVQNCREDYDSGSEQRLTMAMHERHDRAHDRPGR